MQRNTIFTDKFFTPGTVEGADELVGLVGPEDHTQLAEFLKSEDGKQLKKELSELMEILAQWVFANFTDQEYCKNQFDSFKLDYIDYEGGDDSLNRQRVELYRKGISNLRKLIALLQKSNSDAAVPAITKKYIRTLVETLDLCGPAIERAIGDAYKNFIAQKNMPASLEMKRLALLDEYLKAVMVDNGIEDHDTLDRHYVAAIVNQNEAMGISPIKDPNIQYCVEEDLEILQRKTLREFHRIISPENILKEFIAELDMEELILGFRFHQSVSIAKLDAIGSDDEFDPGQIVDLSKVDLLPVQPYAERYIENSILRRLAQAGYLHSFECIKHENCEIHYHPGASMRLWYVLNEDGKYIPYLDYLTAKMLDSKNHVIALLPPQFLSANNFANIYFVLRQQTSIPQSLYDYSLNYVVKNIQDLITVFQNANDDEQKIVINGISLDNITKIITQNKDIHLFNQFLQYFKYPHLLIPTLAEPTGKESILLDELCNSALEQNNVEAFCNMANGLEFPEEDIGPNSHVCMDTLLKYAHAFITKFPKDTIQILEAVLKHDYVFELLLNKIDIKNLKALTNTSEEFLQLLRLLPTYNINTQSFLELFTQDELKKLITTPGAFMLYLATKDTLQDKYEVLKLFADQLSLFINEDNIQQLLEVSFPSTQKYKTMKEYIEFIFKYAVNNEKHLLFYDFDSLVIIAKIVEINGYKDDFLQWLGIETISKVKIENFLQLARVWDSLEDDIFTWQLFNLLSSKVITELLDDLEKFVGFIDLLNDSTVNQENNELNVYKIFADKIPLDFFMKRFYSIENSEHFFKLYQFIRHTTYKTIMEEQVLNLQGFNLARILTNPEELSELLQLPFLKSSIENQQRLLEKLDITLLAKIFTTDNCCEYGEHFSEIPVCFFAKLVDTPDFKIELSDDIPDNYVAILPMDKVTVSTDVDNKRSRENQDDEDGIEETAAKKSKHAASPLLLFSHENSDAPVNEYTSQVNPGSLFDC